MADIQRVKESVNQIQLALCDYACGWKNDDALRTIAQLVRVIECEIGWSPYVAEKLGSLETWVGMLYSVKRWKPWGSTAQIKSFAFQECAKIRMYLPRIENIVGADC